MNTEYIARMENLLRLYALPYDAPYPVVCFEERPCFLIGELIEGLAPNRVRWPKNTTPTPNMDPMQYWRTANP